MTAPQPWDRFAAQGAMCAISTGFGDREDTFWQSGERTASFVLSHVVSHLDRRAIAVDIGVGIGRIAVPIARQFDRVRAVDVSDAMLAQLRVHCERFGVTNVDTLRPEERWDAEPVDFVYSVLTFQHLPSFTDIEAYVGRIARCLTGVAFLQFDTRSRTLLARAKERIPDSRLLPWTWRIGMRRYRRRPQDLRAMFTRCGLRIVRELDPDTALHAFILAPAHSA